MGLNAVLSAGIRLFPMLFYSFLDSDERSSLTSLSTSFFKLPIIFSNLS
jgi:hypothetical protein